MNTEQSELVLSPWFPGSTPPVRRGVYRIQDNTFRCSCCWIEARWNGKEWHTKSFFQHTKESDRSYAYTRLILSSDVKRWRGILKPKVNMASDPDAKEWIHRFIVALTILCGGKSPPMKYVKEYLQKVEVNSVCRLQAWAIENCLCSWMQGIAVCDAAWHLAENCSESEGFNERPKDFTDRSIKWT